jgi:hypothetical protein
MSQIKKDAKPNYDSAMFSGKLVDLVSLQLKSVTS